MTDVAFTAPWASLALVLGAFVIFGGLWPSRVGIVATIAAAIVNYLHWRIFSTIPWGGSFSELWWPVSCLIVEVLALFDAGILLAILSRPTDRSAEADAGEARLRALWAENADLLPPVDVFIATYNEPREVLEKTILGCLAMDWPEARVWVLDDGRRPWVQDMCFAKGAGYITRPDNKGAKAGNINHGLTQTNAPFVAVFDADFVPQRDFLIRTMGFFENEKIGIVQIPHSFYNHDPMQTNLGLQQAMPDDQRFFFEAIMPGRDGWDASFCCGSNSVTRRAIFDEIGGGLPEGSITEDMLLTLASLRKGYITRYLNEPLAYGLAPESTAAFFVQRQRWAQGAIQILYLNHGPLGGALKLRYRLLFLPSAWVTQGLQSVFTILAPILFALFNLAPMVGVDLPGIIFFLLPMIVALLGGISMLAPGRYYPLAAQILSVFQTFRILPAALKTLIAPKGLTFKVTPKGSGSKGGKRGPGDYVLFASLTLMAASLASLAINMLPDYRIVTQDGLLPVVAFWLAFNMVMLLLVAMMCLEKPRVRGEERFDLRQTVTLIGDNGQMLSASRGDISISGIGLHLDAPSGFAVGERVQIVLPDVGILRGEVRYSARRIGILFDFHSEEIRDRLIVSLFTNGMNVNAQRPSALAVAGAIVRRLWSADLSIRAQAASAPEAPEVPVEKLSAATRCIAPGKRPDLRGPVPLTAEEGASLAAAKVAVVPVPAEGPRRVA
ncbi:cellulose synthase (UDP-forming) [Sphingobium sp. B11D3B]|uniref:glycosyltransferase n=1 Tax=Sphingobium sp. B11D3B TaxID=2940575 RepID=UPI002227EE1F|nr:glycosyltransferase [Sphingobium sp. B11D3B]MCW2388226.1 cellulose synthase (UDP-forming) [Sphingobium sp. B11D3B]